MDRLWPARRATDRGQPGCTAPRTMPPARPDCVRCATTPVSLFADRSVTVDAEASPGPRRPPCRGPSRPPWTPPWPLGRRAAADDVYAAWAFQPRQRPRRCGVSCSAAPGAGRPGRGRFRPTRRRTSGSRGAADRGRPVRRPAPARRSRADAARRAGHRAEPGSVRPAGRALDTPVPAPTERRYGRRPRATRDWPGRRCGSAGPRTGCGSPTPRAGRAAVGQGGPLADPPGLRLGQPGLVPVGAALSEDRVAGPLRRARLRAVGLGGGRLVVTLDAWVHDSRRSSTPWAGAVPLLHVAGGPIALTYAAAIPNGSVIWWSTAPAAAAPGPAAHAATVAGRAGGADPDLVGSDEPGFPPGLDARFLARLSHWRPGGPSTSCSAGHLGRERLPAVAGVRRPRRTGAARRVWTCPR